VDLESLGVKPDNLMSYYLWAEDIGPDGKPRRTESDIYFAQIRPFDETYREQQGAAQQSQQKKKKKTESETLGDLVKDITSATWKLRRQNYAPESETQEAAP
jgi:hypothetical protein